MFTAKATLSWVGGSDGEEEVLLPQLWISPRISYLPLTHMPAQDHLAYIPSQREKGRGQVVSPRISHPPLIHTPAQNHLAHIPSQKMEGRGQVAAGNECGCGDVKSKIRCSVTYQINIFYHLFLSPGPFVKTRGKSREGFEESGCLRLRWSERAWSKPGVSRPSPRQNIGMNKAVIRVVLVYTRNFVILPYYLWSYK